MADQKRYTVQYRRKREGKTDYKKRLSLLKSGKTRVVIRRSLKSIRIQFVEYKKEGDKILAQAGSQELVKLGWKHSQSNIPAAYLTGILAGKKAQKNNIQNAIVDLGLEESIKQSRIYGAIKGMIESGIKINAKEVMLPKENRLLGKHIEEHTKKPISKDVIAIKDKIIKN